MESNYKHTQVGYVIIVALAIVIGLLTYVLAFLQFNAAAFAVLIVLVVCLILFATLKVRVDSEYIRLNFGIGLVHKKIKLKEVSSSQIVKNPWHYGWGVRFSNSGWVYNVSGFDAVELKLKNGTTIRIGTDAPVDLDNAVKLAIKKK